MSKLMTNEYVKEIQQVIKIQHYSRFDLFHQALPADGKLEKINLIYGPNGSGKTALSLIAQSLATRKDDIIVKKENKFLLKPSLPKIELLANNNTRIIFSNGHWNSYLTGRVKIFNSYFISNNVYIFNVEDNGFSILELMSAQDAINVKKLIKNIKHAEKRKVRLRHYIKRLKREAVDERIIEQKHKNIEDIISYVEPLKHKYSKIINSYFERVIEEINIILGQFQADFRVKLHRTVLIKKGNYSRISSKILFDIYSADEKHRFVSRDQKISMDYVLSDGDKSSLAFAVYTSLLKLNQQLKKQIVFIDDPFTSMDSDRRHNTIMYLMDIIRNCSQVFITSHDKQFLNDVSREIRRLDGGKYQNQCLNLQIDKYNYGKSKIRVGNFNRVNLDNVIYDKFKEFIRMDKQYSLIELKDLGQNIRPLLEDAFKFKFPDYYVEGQTWLKSYLDFIRLSDDKHYQDFRRLKSYLSDFGSVLSYTAKFNHSNRDLMEVNEAELRSEIERTLKLFSAI